MDCPKCKLINLPAAERCDCGYDFTTRTMEHSYLTEHDRRLSKSGIPGAVVVGLLAIRFTLGLARVAGERQRRTVGLVLLVLVNGFIFWLWRKRSS
jgi:hypothetical protein